MNLYWPKRSYFRSAKAKQKRFLAKLARAEAAAVKVLNVSHGGCLDGAGSVVMTMRKFGPENVGVAYCQPSDVQRVLAHYAQVPGRGRTLMVTDLSMNARHLAAVVAACQGLKANDWRIEWRDHHHKQWEGIDLASLKAAVDELEVSPNTESGASMQQKALLPRDAFAKKLAALHRDRDLWLNEDPDSETLEFAITNMGTDAFVKHMVGKKGRDKVVDAVIAAAADAERANTEAAANALLRATKYYETSAGERVGIVYGWLPKNVGLHEVLEEENVMVAANVRPNGAMSIRSRRGADVCQQVASQFGGGGHVNASGAHLGMKGAKFWWYVARRGRVARVQEVAKAAVAALEARA